MNPAFFFSKNFYNEEAEKILLEYLKEEKVPKNNNDRLVIIGHERFLRAWKRARETSGVYLKPKDLRDFFSQEMGKALITDRFIDIFQGRSPRSVLAKHYTPQGIK